MARVQRISTLSLVPATLVLLAFLAMSLNGAEAQLSETFYALTCPSVELIVYNEMVRLIVKRDTLPPDLLRLFFHDCFVRGCDGSILLEGKGTERDSPSNFRLENFRSVDAIKRAVEKACPNTVSCADILAFATRDGVYLRGGPRWTVKGGRRDGLVSIAAEATANLPGPDMNVAELTATFARQGFTMQDMVHLSGAHTIGDSGCQHIDSRIYVTPTDPLLPADYLAELRSKCKKPGLRLKTVDLDRDSPMAFDTKYWENLVERKGLLKSDQVLFEDPATKGMVYDNLVQSTFFENFAAAMIKLSEKNVLTGTAGEIRKQCFAVNKHSY